MTEPAKDPVATAQDLTGTLKNVLAEMVHLRKYGRTNRKFVIVDVVLTVLLAGVGGLSVHAASQADQNRTAQIVTCQASNQARAQNEQLWTYLINLSTSQPPRPGETSAQKAASKTLISLLRAKVSATFAARDCQKLARGQKP